MHIQRSWIWAIGQDIIMYREKFTQFAEISIDAFRIPFWHLFRICLNIATLVAVTRIFCSTKNNCKRLTDNISRLKTRRKGMIALKYSVKICHVSQKSQRISTSEHIMFDVLTLRLPCCILCLIDRRHGFHCLGTFQTWKERIWSSSGFHQTFR